MKFLDNLLIKASIKMANMKKDNGSVTIEQTLIVIILVLLAVVFKTYLDTNVDNIFTKFADVLNNQVFTAL